VNDDDRRCLECLCALEMAAHIQRDAGAQQRQQ
jgi:hypothetical protein